MQWPCAPGQSAVPSHMEQRSRHRTAKAAMSYSCKHVPMYDRLSTHRTREDPRGIRETARAQAAPRESRRHDTGASNTSMRTAPNKRAHLAALSYCSPSLHADLAQNVLSEACSELLRTTFCGCVASLQIEPSMDSMSAAVFSSLSIFSTTSSTSWPACRMLEQRCRSYQQDERDSEETSPRA